MVFEKVPEAFFYKSEHESELFINSDYLVVYKNTKLYYLQKIDFKSNIDELKQYLQKSLKFDNLITTKKENINLNKNSSHEFIKIYKSNLFNYFIIYLFLLCFCFYSFDFVEKYNVNGLRKLQDKTASLKKDIEFKFISEEVISLYQNAKKSNLQITALSFKESKFLISLESKEKNSIYTFLEMTKNSSIENMKFDEKRKRHIANASFKIYRR